MKRRVVVISGVNIVEAGPLSVFRDCLAAAQEVFPPSEYVLVALVNSRRLFATRRIRFLEFPRAKQSYLRRAWLEYVSFRRISRQLGVDLWFSIHDVTPNVTARIRAVYCHNPVMFYRPSLREVVHDYKLLLFKALYSLLYRINLSLNTWVVVQQQWIREDFSRRYGLPRERIVVAYPSAPSGIGPRISNSPAHGRTFIYPALPRPFKNHAVVGEAIRLLVSKGITAFSVAFTVSGDENSYAAELKERYSDLSQLRFLGPLERGQVLEHLAASAFLLFPSKLETWGLPITEAKQLGLPMIVARARYSAETVGDYASVSFFDPDDPADLASLMSRAIAGTLSFDGNRAPPRKAPLVDSWVALLRLLSSRT